VPDGASVTIDVRNGELDVCYTDPSSAQTHPQTSSAA
jgi:hypothetical protein